jgi:hypothetical protein
MKLIRKFEEFAHIYYIPSEKAIQVSWYDLRMPLAVFEEVCFAALDVVVEKGVRLWIADSSQSIGSFRYQVQVFILKDLVEQAEVAGIKRIWAIMPQKKGLSTFAVNSWVKHVSKRNTFEMKVFSSAALLPFNETGKEREVTRPAAVEKSDRDVESQRGSQYSPKR